ncbi:MAG: hypothetical protein AAFV01_14940 [Bacteroidota bacterium]
MPDAEQLKAYLADRALNNVLPIGIESTQTSRRTGGIHVGPFRNTHVSSKTTRNELKAAKPAAR